ncbi:MAG: hypothetical protein R3F62_11665 [Planctomycetota bacterium]
MTQPNVPQTLTRPAPTAAPEENSGKPELGLIVTVLVLWSPLVISVVLGVIALALMIFKH